MILGKLIDDVVLRVGPKPSDDDELSRSQVGWWISNIRDGVVKEYLDSQIKGGYPLDSFYVERETCKAATSEEVECVDAEDERIYLTLLKQPMALYNDAGVLRVLTSDGVMLDKSRMEAIDWVKDLKYGKPTTKRPVWYRDNKIVVLEGVSYKNLQETYIVYYIPSASSQALDETQDIKISDELLPVILEKVEELARREMGVPIDNIDNGKDDRLNG